MQKHETSKTAILCNHSMCRICTNEIFCWISQYISIWSNSTFEAKFEVTVEAFPSIFIFSFIRFILFYVYFDFRVFIVFFIGCMLFVVVVFVMFCMWAISLLVGWWFLMGEKNNVKVALFFLSMINTSCGKVCDAYSVDATETPFLFYISYSIAEC